MRVVLVCGDRHWGEKEKEISKLEEAIKKLHREEKITYLVHGGGGRADELAGSYARRRGIQTVECKANWTCYGLSAGPIRNRMQLRVAQRLAESDKLVVLAFHSNLKESRGTKDMIKAAREETAADMLEVILVK